MSYVSREHPSYLLKEQQNRSNADAAGRRRARGSQRESQTTQQTAIRKDIKDLSKKEAQGSSSAGGFLFCGARHTDQQQARYPKKERKAKKVSKKHMADSSEIVLNSSNLRFPVDRRNYSELHPFESSIESRLLQPSEGGLAGSFGDNGDQTISQHTRLRDQESQSNSLRKEYLRTIGLNSHGGREPSGHRQFADTEVQLRSQMLGAPGSPAGARATALEQSDLSRPSAFQPASIALGTSQGSADFLQGNTASHHLKGRSPRRHQPEDKTTVPTTQLSHDTLTKLDKEQSEENSPIQAGSNQASLKRTFEYRQTGSRLDEEEDVYAQSLTRFALEEDNMNESNLFATNHGQACSKTPERERRQLPLAAGPLDDKKSDLHMSRAESQGGLTIREKINLFGMGRGPSPDQGSSRSSVGSRNSKSNGRVSSVAKRHLGQGQGGDKRSNSTLNKPNDAMMAMIKKKNAIELGAESASRATARQMKRQSEMMQTSRLI